MEVVVVGRVAEKWLGLVSCLLGGVVNVVANHCSIHASVTC
jgi:hypothetical protein